MKYWLLKSEPSTYGIDDLAKDKAYEFMFVLGPLLLKGGIGVPINPLAIL